MQFDRLKRREFISLLGGAAVWPLAAGAQQGERVRRIGVLMGFATTDPEAQTFQRAFSRRLRELGWTDGTTARFDYRWASGDYERFKAYASELVALKPDVILANTTPAVAALRQETTTIPIVFVQITDPVSQGFVRNLARPSGNMTGFDFVDFSVGGKWLELLKEAAPAVTRVAVMYNPQTSPEGYLPSLRSAAGTLRVEEIEAPVREDERDRACHHHNERAARRRAYRDGRRIHGRASRTDHRACRSPSPAGHVPPTHLCNGGRIDGLRHRRGRAIQARGGLYRSHPQGRRSRRAAGTAADKVRAGAQPQDCKDAGHRVSAQGARSRR